MSVVCSIWCWFEFYLVYCGLSFNIPGIWTKEDLIWNVSIFIQQSCLPSVVVVVITKCNEFCTPIWSLKIFERLRKRTATKNYNSKLTLHWNPIHKTPNTFVSHVPNIYTYNRINSFTNKQRCTRIRYSKYISTFHNNNNSQYHT